MTTTPAAQPPPAPSHYITAATHVTTDEEGPVGPMLHHFTVHCYCGYSGYAQGADPLTALDEARDHT